MILALSLFLVGSTVFFAIAWQKKKDKVGDLQSSVNDLIKQQKIESDAANRIFMRRDALRKWMRAKGISKADVPKPVP